MHHIFGRSEPMTINRKAAATIQTAIEAWTCSGHLRDVKNRMINIIVL